jgi:hypothetical protein
MTEIPRSAAFYAQVMLGLCAVAFYAFETRTKFRAVSTKEQLLLCHDTHAFLA